MVDVFKNHAGIPPLLCGAELYLKLILQLFI